MKRHPKFVWAKITDQGSESLDHIIQRKEAERQLGDFWWGMGAHLGEAVLTAANESHGTLPVVFSKNLASEQQGSTTSGDIYVWQKYVDPRDGQPYDIPKHVLTIGEQHQNQAMVCNSTKSLRLERAPFDPSLCFTAANNRPANQAKSSVAVLLTGNLNADHSDGKYKLGFRASLVGPCLVQLVDSRKLTKAEVDMIDAWIEGDNWLDLVHSIRKT